jgi:C4-dicarboxylate transporter DctM subunit
LWQSFLSSPAATTLPREPRPSLAEFVHANVVAFPALLLPVIVLGGIYSGFITVSEAAGVSAIAAAIIAVFIYRELALRDLPRVIMEAIRTSATIMIIVAMAFGMSHWIAETGVTRALVEWVNESGLEAWQFLLAINLLLLLLGMILETFAILMLTLPLIAPILPALGIDPVHFAILMVVNMELGLLTPPIGLNLFVLASTAKVPVGTVVRGVLPFIGAMMVLLLLITYVPAISTFLPNYFYGVTR